MSPVATSVGRLLSGRIPVLLRCWVSFANTSQRCAQLAPSVQGGQQPDAYRGGDGGTALWHGPLTRCDSAGLHFTYPHDKRRALEQAAAARGDAARAAADMRNGTANAEDSVEAGASPLKGPSAAEHGTEMARLILPHSHEPVMGSEE